MDIGPFTMTEKQNGLDALLNQWLAACVARDASDLHLVVGLPPHLRIHGELTAIPSEPNLNASDLRAIADDLLARMARRSEEARLNLGAALSAKGSFDGAMTAPDQTRFRFNLFRRQGNISIALRRLEDRFQTLAELGLPTSLYGLCDLRDGLIVVSGPTGAGKSTTLATLLDRINRQRHGHIITIEDPIEYIHRPISCVVNQRQVGLDAPSFNDALVASLRQDPDIVLVGEIRDLETIRTAITAAETGHLIFTTLHAGDCVGSIERLVSVFPADEQDGIRRQLSLVLRCIVAQRLLPAAHGVQTNGYGRVVASEILIGTSSIANLIVTGKSAQIYSVLETGSSLGMQTLEQDLARLWVSGRITEAAAAAMARNPSILRDRYFSLKRRNEASAGEG